MDAREWTELHRQIRREAEVLAGGLTDLSQRAAVYHHLYQHSGGNHVFPLLAAHGALWGRGYFANGMRAGRMASATIAGDQMRRERLAALSVFADRFREINRRVCVETYTAYHFTRLAGTDTGARAFVPGRLLHQLNACHEACRQGRLMTREERRELFAAFFLWEQDTIVGPAVEMAFAEFDWPLIRHLARRPRIAFAYIPWRWQFRFANFEIKSERVARGLQALELAERVGWRRTEDALRDYNIMPETFHRDAAVYFAGLRHRLVPQAA